MFFLAKMQAEVYICLVLCVKKRYEMGRHAAQHTLESSSMDEKLVFVHASCAGIGKRSTLLCTALNRQGLVTNLDFSVVLLCFFGLPSQARWFWRQL